MFPSSMCILHLRHSHYYPCRQGTLIPLHVRTATCDHAHIPGEQHFHKVYLSCHMQVQGLLTDMISLAHGKGTHYPWTVWSNLHSLSTPLICPMLGTANDDSLNAYKKMAAVEANTWWQAGRAASPEMMTSLIERLDSRWLTKLVELTGFSQAFFSFSPSNCQVLLFHSGRQIISIQMFYVIWILDLMVIGAFSACLLAPPAILWHVCSPCCYTMWQHCSRQASRMPQPRLKLSALTCMLTDQ